jgi:pimeloyl-ACP methyl ester carboxylesterase
MTESTATTTPTVVLVHGAFADASSWAGVIRKLQEAGVTAQAVANPLRGLALDADYVAAQVNAVDGPVVLVGHSYGGSVISAASPKTPNTAALVYVAAFVPDEGETAFELAGRFADSDLGANVHAVEYPLPDGGTAPELYLDDAYRAVFAADVPEHETVVAAASQRPAALGAFNEKTGPVGWKTLPSWHAVATEDHSINPDVERFGAQRAGSTVVEITGSHSIAVSQPAAVADVILSAVRSVS